MPMRITDVHDALRSGKVEFRVIERSRLGGPAAFAAFNLTVNSIGIVNSSVLVKATNLSFTEYY